MRSNAITKLTPVTDLSKSQKKIAIFDIKTICINDRLYPYSIGFVAEKKIKIFYIMDYFKGDFIQASHTLVRKFINFLNILKENYIIFGHNMRNFDGYLILDQLLNQSPQLLIDD